MTDPIANTETALAAFKQALSADDEIARTPRGWRARAKLILKRCWRITLYNAVYGYWLVLSRDRSGRLRVYVSDNPEGSGFPSPKGFFW
jgi:hypothetical protein